MTMDAGALIAVEAARLSGSPLGGQESRFRCPPFEIKVLAGRAGRLIGS